MPVRRATGQRLVGDAAGRWIADFAANAAATATFSRTLSPLNTFGHLGLDADAEPGDERAARRR